MAAAKINGGPPTKLTVKRVVAADKPYMTLRPKLSGKLLSTPEQVHREYVKRPGRRESRYLQSLSRICLAVCHEIQCRGTGSGQIKHPRGGLRTMELFEQYSDQGGKKHTFVEYF